MAVHFLKRYPTQYELGNRFHVSRDTIHNHCFYYVELIRGLKKKKIGWPSDNFGNLIWVMSVDGVHFRTQEPTHPTLPKDKAYFSFKHKCAGFNYEVGVALHESRCVWLRGPYMAGTYNDIKIFKEKGLRKKLRKYKKKVICDAGYRGYPKYISIANSRDSEEVRQFKIRARQRHEKYNGMLKEFECLSDRFRHNVDMEGKLQACFEAVAVITQYKMELGTPLFII